ncbi:MAG TPA: hypothetical protein VKM94_13110 [Blastocatellia bacterium]|nr:hypothetical protein [Blastocatellia bacterium]
MSSKQQTRNFSGPKNQWSITYTQTDLDMIREQIEATESSKRRSLLFALLIASAALVAIIVSLASIYGQYSSSESEKKRLTDENAALRSTAQETQQQLDVAKAKLEQDAQKRQQSQTKLEKATPPVVRGVAGPSEVGAFARMVHNLPGARIELDQKPSDKLFRNWKVSDGKTTEIYALVGGVVDGKWVLYSNLVSKRGSE